MSNYKEIYQKQKDFFNTLTTYSYEFRKEMLIKLYEMIKNNENQICNALYLDLNKSKMESYMCEIGLTLHHITTTIKNLKKWMKPTKVKSGLANFPSTSKIYNDPYGLTLIISPWNYPVLLALDPLIGAISGGNTCILKLSEYSSHTSKLLKELINTTFDSSYIYAYDGNSMEANELLDFAYDFIFFTGSTNVGKIVMEKASHHLTPVCLELGGKSPCIVTADAKLELATKRIVYGKILNAGQTCVAPDYIYIDEKIKDQFINLLIKEINTSLGENPCEHQDYPKIINEKHLNRLLKLIDYNKLIYGGKSLNGKLEPTIIDHVTFSDRIMQEEIFGPILPIITYKDISEVYTTLQNLDYPLSLYLFSQDKRIIKKTIKYCRYGGGCINDTLMHLVADEIPFGGVGKSGMGNYHGKETFNIFTHQKGILNKSTKMDIKLRYYPYTLKKQKLIKKILK